MLRPAADADMADVRRWRNHPDVRSVSLSQHEISEPEHRSWWTATQETNRREVYIYERHGIPSGVVTFFDIDPDAASASWGYYLDNAGLEERGELMPAWIQIQREARRLAFGELGLTTLEGEVLVYNESARSFNRRNGFAEVETYSHDIDGVRVPVVRVRATKEPIG